MKASLYLVIICSAVVCFTAQGTTWAQELRIPLNSGFSPIPSQAQIQGRPSPFEELTLTILLTIQNPEKYVKYFDEMSLGKRLSVDKEKILLESFQLPLPDYDAFINWLNDQGLTIIYMDRVSNRQLVRVTGRIEQLEKAFGVTFIDIELENERFSAAQNQATLPQSVAKYVRAIDGFQPYRKLMQVENMVVKKAPKQ